MTSMNPEKRRYEISENLSEHFPEVNLFMRVSEKEGDTATLILGRSGHKDRRVSLEAGESTVYLDCEIRLIKARLWPHQGEKTAYLGALVEVSGFDPLNDEYVIQQIRRLERLKEQNVLTEAEYEKKRKSIIDSL